MHVRWDQWIEVAVIVTAAEFGATHLHSNRWILGGGIPIANLQFQSSIPDSKVHPSIHDVFC